MTLLRILGLVVAGLLDDVATLRASMAELKARQEQSDRELARMKRGGAPPERRHVSLEEAGRLGPPCGDVPHVPPEARK